jgi:hypothetical protein
MAHQRALLFDRTLEVDSTAAIVRVRPQRAAAVAMAAVIAAFPLVLLVITRSRSYGLTLYGNIFTYGFLLAALLVLALAFSPRNRFFEFDFRNGRARIGRRFGLGSPVDVPLESVTLYYDESIREVGNETIMTTKAIASVDGAMIPVLAISGDRGGLAAGLVDAVSSQGQSLPELGALASRVGASEARRLILTALLIVGAGGFYIWWYLFR